jgi:hypothetical protein
MSLSMAAGVVQAETDDRSSSVSVTNDSSFFDRVPPVWLIVAVYVAGGVLILVLGRNLWFLEDDWSYLLWHDAPRLSGDYSRWLNRPLNGHWVAVPQVVYWATEQIFGLRSDFPFVLPSLLMHIGIVELVRRHAIRAGATPLTALAVSTVVLLLGSAREFILHGPITSYQYSLLAFLGALLLMESPTLNARHFAASALLVVGVMASAYGLLFLPGVAVASLGRRRWAISAVVLVPSSMLLSWWWLTWSGDASSDRVPGPRSLAPKFAMRGIEATIEVLLSVGALVGVALVLIVWFGIVRVPAERAWCTVWPLSTALVVSFAALGFQRIGFGVDAAATPKYSGVGAVLLAPAVAVTVDATRRFGPQALGSLYLLLAVSVGVNLGAMQFSLSERAERAQQSRMVFDLVAGSQLEVAPDRSLSLISPDVQFRDLERLVERGAINPRSPVTASEWAVVRDAIGN